MVTEVLVPPRPPRQRPEVPGLYSWPCHLPVHPPAAPPFTFFFFLAGGLSLATGTLHATHVWQPSTDDQQEREYKHSSSLTPQVAAGPWSPESPVGPSSTAHRGRPDSASAAAVPSVSLPHALPTSWSQSPFPGTQIKASPFPTPRAASLPCPHPRHPQSLVLTPPLPSFPTALLYVLGVTSPYQRPPPPASHSTSQPRLQEGVEVAVTCAP